MIYIINQYNKNNYLLIYICNIKIYIYVKHKQIIIKYNNYVII